MEKLPSPQPSISTSKISAEEAVKQANLLLGCYRSIGEVDAPVFSGAVMAVLASYPLAVVEKVTNPVSGLPSRSKWMPSISEIKEACDALVYDDMARIGREMAVHKQFEERALADALDEERHQRLSYEELKAKYREAWAAEKPQEPKDYDRRDLAIAEEMRLTEPSDELQAIMRQQTQGETQ